MKNTLHSLLRHHVTGAIERGEAKAIVEIPALHKGALPLHITKNDDHFVIVTSQGTHYAKTFDPSAARLIASAPDLILALENLLSDRSCPRFLTLDEWHNTHLDFRSTLRKAKGEA